MPKRRIMSVLMVLLLMLGVALLGDFPAAPGKENAAGETDAKEVTEELVFDEDLLAYWRVLNNEQPFVSTSEDGVVYGYQFGFRGMKRIHQNGVYEGSDGAASTSYHRLTELNKEGCTEDMLACCLLGKSAEGAYER